MAEPKYRTIKIPKPRSRGIRGKMALQQWQRSGGRQKQILNPETGKYEKALFGEAGQRQVQKLYPTKERGESIKKVEKAKVEQAKRQKAGAAEAKKKAEALLAETKKKRKEKEAKAKAEKEAKAKAEPAPPPPTTGRLTRGPGPEAPPPPPRVRITEEAPKPSLADLSELPIRDQKELNAVLKDLKNKVISPDFKTPTQAEIAEAVTKATGGRYTPPTSKVAEPPPPKAEPVVPAPSVGMDDVKNVVAATFGGSRGGGQTKTTITPTELAAKAQELREAAADPKTSSSKLLALAKEVQDATRVVQEQTAEKQAKAKTADEKATPGKLSELFGGIGGGSSSSELDKLKARHSRLTGMRFITDPGPEHFQAIKDLEDQITALDPSFVGEFSSSGGITPPTKIDIPGGGQVTLPKFPVPGDPDFKITNMPVPGPTDSKLESTLAPTPAPPPPQFVNMDPLQGVRERYVPTNILGQSFDPGVREDYARRMMQAGANVQQGGSPTFQMPTSAVPQVQFGGYGAPVPMAPLAPYAGLGGPPPPPQIASGAIINPGTGQPEPVGMAPDPRLVNRPPGTGPIT